MKDWQRRVIDEKAELDDKIIKLTAFIRGDSFNELDVKDRELLYTQRSLMVRYSSVLGERIMLYAALVRPPG